MKKAPSSYTFSAEELKTDLFREATALRIHRGFAEQIVKKIIDKIEIYQSSHPVITKKDIEKLVYTELKKYNKDFAFIYKNRDKII